MNKRSFQQERERLLDEHYMEDQRREWELRDKKQQQQNDARAALMKACFVLVY